MKKSIYLLTILSFLLCNLKAQDDTPLYFENAPNAMKRFFYDQNYYLVDKNCEFKYIERVSAFDIKTNKFEGVFKDFDPNGRIVLSGQYVSGKKHGEFKAYHPNGRLKWETTFIDDIATGPWKYYYPDGKPMLFLTLQHSNFHINQYWDRKGQQLVKDGEGTYDIDLPVIGFTEHGYTRYNRRGKIKNGLPEGLWYISFVENGKRKDKIHLMTEQYENGQWKGQRIEEEYEDLLITKEDFVFAPNDYFQRAENLLSKKCSFDEFTGFNIFIANKFVQYLEQVSMPSKQDQEKKLSYEVKVSKNGTPSIAILLDTESPLSKDEKNIFSNMINQIVYYLPSYSNNNPISDKLTVKFTLQTKGEEIHIAPVQIHREKGI